MAISIGTAGHVDHGKTSLIRALTGVDTDRLPEEKARGMTIDLGYAELTLNDGSVVSVIDVPGHERFITNMLAGALGIRVALLCVAADSGPMPQTIEHLRILDLLPVESLVVAVTRVDLADSARIELAIKSTQQILETTRFGSSQVIPVSSVTGFGLDELRAALGAVVTGLPSSVPMSGGWALPIDRVFTMKGHGVIVTGTLARNAVQEGDLAEIVPSRFKTRVRSLHVHGHQVERALPGQRVAINLVGVEKNALHRGNVVSPPGSLESTRCIDLSIRWIADYSSVERIRLAIGADDVLGRLRVSESDSGTVQVILDREIGAFRDQPVIIRRHSPPDLLGGGFVLVPRGIPKKSGGPQRELSLDESLVNLIEGASGGVETAEICRLLGRTPQELGDTLEELVDCGKAIGFAGLWFSSATLKAARDRFLRALEEVHAQNPRRASVSRDLVVSQSGLKWSGKPLERLVAYFASQGDVRVRGAEVTSVHFRIELPARQRELLDKLVVHLSEGGINPPMAHDLAKSVQVPQQAVDEVLQIGVQTGELYFVGEGIFYPSAVMQSLVAQLRELGADEYRFTASEFRDRMGTSRKYAIPLLEFFDARGLTVRQGDTRVLARRRK